MPRRQPQNEHTQSEQLSVKLENGTVVTGTLWMSPSRRGSFMVEYEGIRHTDHRNDYTSEKELKSAARMILREVAERD